MTSVEEQIANQIANIERATGRGFQEWIEIVRAAGLPQHARAVAMLKTEYGLGHGNANLIVTKARESAAGGPATPDDLVAAQYAGKNAGLLPLYRAVIDIAQGLGPDVELAPKKSYVSLRRRKQFGQVGTAAGQLEVSLNLAGKEPTDRLQRTSGMATHRVRISDEAGIDEALVGWLREAYERA